MKMFKSVDKLILGCTHYPLFKTLMQKELSSKIEIIDTGVELAKYLKNKICELDIQTSNVKGSYKIYLTDIDSTFANIATSILNENISVDEINKLEL